MTKTILIEVTEDEYDMVLEALQYTKQIKFLNEEAKKEYRDLYFKLGGEDE